MDEIMPPSEDARERSLGVVDACQGRFSQEELHSWISQDSVALITGSTKFYQAPPLCVAVLVPKAVAEKVRNEPDGLRDFFVRHGFAAVHVVLGTKAASQPIGAECWTSSSLGSSTR